MATRSPNPDDMDMDDRRMPDHRTDLENPHEDRRDRSWIIPLLLIPVAFYIGWAVRGNSVDTLPDTSNPQACITPAPQQGLAF